MSDEPLSYRMAYFQAQNHITALEKQVEELRKDKERLRTLINMTDLEGQNGRWAITLEYENYQDIAMVLNADGEIIGQCGEIGIEPNEQFIRAIDAAIDSAEKEDKHD